MAQKEGYLNFDEYIRQGEPDKKENLYLADCHWAAEEMSAYEWAKGHSGVLLADDVVKRDEE